MVRENPEREKHARVLGERNENVDKNIHNANTTTSTKKIIVAPRSKGKTPSLQEKPKMIDQAGSWRSPRILSIAFQE